MVLTLCLCIVYGSQNRQLLPYTALAGWFFCNRGESGYCSVRTESLQTDYVSS